MIRLSLVFAHIHALVIEDAIVCHYKLMNFLVNCFERDWKVVQFFGDFLVETFSRRNIMIVFAGLFVDAHKQSLDLTNFPPQNTISGISVLTFSLILLIIHLACTSVLCDLLMWDAAVMNGPENDATKFEFPALLLI